MRGMAKAAGNYLFDLPRLVDPHADETTKSPSMRAVVRLARMAGIGDLLRSDISDNGYPDHNSCAYDVMSAPKLCLAVAFGTEVAEGGASAKLRNFRT
jgi:hypothetical protein